MLQSLDSFTIPPSPFQRRYQVFVSSTYEDLKEERRHVIQALLESKCIPAGMELFPAASIEQWELIKRVIDESDYYIVIVAGRYGSRGADGRSYTEMEFDYAIATGKSVMGFYYENVLDLPGMKLERTDAGRKELDRFTAKVKSKLCRSWRTPEALGSAIKSAIFSEIEFNPQPGWVRASSQADPALILRLKQRVADLEAQIESAKSRGRKVQLAHTADEMVEIEIEVHSEAKSPNPGDAWRDTHSLERRIVKVPWPILFGPLGIKLKKSRDRTDINAMLKQVALNYTKFNGVEVAPCGFELKHVRLSKSTTDRFPDGLLAEKLIQEIRTTKYEGMGSRKINQFRLTQKGNHLAATLRVSDLDEVNMSARS